MIDDDQYASAAGEVVDSLVNALAWEAVEIAFPDDSVEIQAADLMPLFAKVAAHAILYILDLAAGDPTFTSAIQRSYRAEVQASEGEGAVATLDQLDAHLAARIAALRCSYPLPEVGA